jgi:hypothetical protein
MFEIPRILDSLLQSWRDISAWLVLAEHISLERPFT